MMQESKLNNFQQRQLNARLRSGESLPTACHPTTSAKTRTAKKKPENPKILNPRNYSGGVKPREAIEASGVYERPDYKPRPVGDERLLSYHIHPKALKHMIKRTNLFFKQTSCSHRQR